MQGFLKEFHEIAVITSRFPRNWNRAQGMKYLEFAIRQKVVT
jgi:hypothetical protein